MGLVGIRAQNEAGEWGLIAVGSLLSETLRRDHYPGPIFTDYEVQVDASRPPNTDAAAKLFNLYHNRDPLRIVVLGSTRVEDEYYEVLCKSIDGGRYIDLDLTVQQQLELSPAT